jgi:hypothetical protein
MSLPRRSVPDIMKNSGTLTFVSIPTKSCGKTEIKDAPSSYLKQFIYPKV